MKVSCSWNEKMKFAACANSHKVVMDAMSPIGSDSAMTPKQLVLAGICGCAGMDVVSLLRKYKQPLTGLIIEAEAIMTEGHTPSVFKEVRLNFLLKGEIKSELAMDAVLQSQTKFCGVSAMLSKAAPIYYSVNLNGEVLDSGQAKFD